jgi:hypothetical protein
MNGQIAKSTAFIHSPTDNSGSRREEREEEVDGHELATAENETRGDRPGGASEQGRRESVPIR